MYISQKPTLQTCDIGCALAGLSNGLSVSPRKGNRTLLFTHFQFSLRWSGILKYEKSNFLKAEDLRPLNIYFAMILPDFPLDECKILVQGGVSFFT